MAVKPMFNVYHCYLQTMDEISTLENDIKGIKEAIDAKNAPMMVCDHSAGSCMIYCDILSQLPFGSELVDFHEFSHSSPTKLLIV